MKALVNLSICSSVGWKIFFSVSNDGKLDIAQAFRLILMMF